MLYEFTLFFQNGSCHALLTEVTTHNGFVYGTQVGALDGFDDQGNLVYRECNHRSYVAGGSAFTLVEYKGELKKA